MATSVGLNFRLTAAVENFEKSMADVNRKLSQIDKSSRTTASGMKLLAGIEVGKLLVGGLTKVAGLASSAASSVIGFASQAADAADKIGKLATMTGMAEEPLQVFTQMAAYGGVSSTQFGDALQKMSRGLGEAANGTGTAKRGLEQLGLSVDDLLKMSPSQQFMQIAAAIDKIEDPTKRSAVAADIFGRSGTKLIPMFEDIEANAASLSQEMLSLGQVLSKDQVNNIEAMNDSFEKVRQTAFKIGSQVVANFAPALTAANNALMEMVKNFEYEGATGGQGVAKLFTNGLFAGARSMAEMLDRFLGGFDDAVGLLISALAKLIAAFEIVSAPFIGSDAAARLGAFAQKLEGAAKSTEGVDVSFVSLIDKAQKLFQNADSAADGLGGLAPKAAGGADGVAKLAGEAKKGAAAASGLASGSVFADGKLKKLAGETQNNSAKAKVSAHKLAELANSAADAKTKFDAVSPQVAEESIQSMWLDGAEQSKLGLELMSAAAGKAHKEEVFGFYDNLWQQEADRRMEIFRRSGRFDEGQLQARMAFDKKNFQDRLTDEMNHTIGYKRLLKDYAGRRQEDHDQWWETTYGDPIDKGRFKLEADYEKISGGKSLSDAYDQLLENGEITREEMMPKLDDISGGKSMSDMVDEVSSQTDKQVRAMQDQTAAINQIQLQPVVLG